MTADIVALDIADHVAEIALNRPDRMNAITPELIREMDAAAQAAAADPSVRAVVLRGNGRAFCAGLDKEAFGAMLRDPSALGDLAERTHGDANLFQHAAMLWRKLPVPVVASLHGATLGGGLQIALGADVRIGGTDLKMSVMEMKWGLVPDMGGMALMRRLMRGDAIRRLTYTAETLDARAALDLGLVTELAEDPLARARALATEIATRSPAALRAAKKLLNAAEAEGEAEILLAESRIQMEVIGKPEQIECVMAGLEGRAPKFG